MKLYLQFWQKAFLCVIVCFLICFNVTAYMIVQKSYDMSIDNEIVTADNEAYIIKESITERLLSVSQYYTSLNANNIPQYIAPYAEYYLSQKTYIALYQNGTLLFTSFPGALPDIDFAPKEKYIQFSTIDDRQYLLLARHLEIPEYNFIFAYIKDKESLTQYRQDIAGYAIKVGTAVSVGLSVLLIFMLLRLTRPIRILNKAAKEIAGGDYQKRAVIKSRDEIGEFAEIFNGMADNIETHIEELSRLTEEKQRFIDNLSHEMRTPVTAVMGYGELLKNADIGAEERLTATDYIISQSLRLQNLSAKLLQLSSMKSDAIKMEPVCIRDIVERAQRTLCKLYEAKNIAFEINLNDNSIIIGDADLLESLFQNLFENALGVLGTSGKIKVYSQTACNRLCIMIEDNGPGIPQGELEKIFEPFYRVDKARTRAHGGAGLGLSICKQICDLHNAELTVASAPNIGTQIKLCFTT